MVKKDTEKANEQQPLFAKKAPSKMGLIYRAKTEINALKIGKNDALLLYRIFYVQQHDYHG